VTSKDHAGRIEIRLAGEGGQGMILAGIILAEAAAIYDNKNATQTQNYGRKRAGARPRPKSLSAAVRLIIPR